MFARSVIRRMTTISSSTAPITAESLQARIAQSFQPSHMQVDDTSGGCGQSFAVLIVSDSFQGKSILQRHRMVNEQLKNEISQMHAFSQKCLTPQQWQEQQK